VFALGADVIAGFPGEREEDHAETLAFVRGLPFTSLHLCPYSPRPGTAAERLRDPVAPRLARARATELRALGEAKASAHRLARAGGTADVVAIGAGERRSGLTEDYLEVSVPPDAPARFDATLVARDGSLVAEARVAAGARGADVPY
jgi:threonylcarbamoyladenosine tRNA methylthiotransferase MtaB